MVETYRLGAPPIYADEMNMDTQKFRGTKDTYGLLSSANPPISVAAPKPPLPYMESGYFFPTKTTSFASSNVYLPMYLIPPALFGSGINYCRTMVRIALLKEYLYYVGAPDDPAGTCIF